MNSRSEVVALFVYIFAQVISKNVRAIVNSKLLAEHAVWARKLGRTANRCTSVQQFSVLIETGIILCCKVDPSKNEYNDHKSRKYADRRETIASLALLISHFTPFIY